MNFRHEYPLKFKLIVASGIISDDPGGWDICYPRSIHSSHFALCFAIRIDGERNAHDEAFVSR